MGTETLNIITANVRGIRNVIKRRALFRHLHTTYPGHIVALQETYSKKDDEHYWSAEWGSKIIFSHGASTNQGGVALLLPARMESLVKSTIWEENGRLIIAELHCLGRTIYVAVVYAPTSSQQAQQLLYLNKLEQLLSRLSESNELIICGDFNTHLSALDTSARFVRTATSARLAEILDKFDLIDAWRHLHPNTNGFTWKRSFSTASQQSRIDFIFISESLVRTQGITGIHVSPAFRSDHKIVRVCLKICEDKRGPGAWRFNNSLLGNEEFRDKVLREIEQAREGTGVYDIDDPGLLIEVLMGSIRAVTISTSKYLAKERNKDEKDLLSKLVRCIIQMQQGTDMRTEYNEYKSKWEEIQEKRLEKLCFSVGLNGLKKEKSPRDIF